MYLHTSSSTTLPSDYLPKHGYENDKIRIYKTMQWRKRVDYSSRAADHVLDKPHVATATHWYNTSNQVYANSFYYASNRLRKQCETFSKKCWKFNFSTSRQILKNIAIWIIQRRYKSNLVGNRLWPWHKDWLADTSCHRQRPAIYKEISRGNTQLLPVSVTTKCEKRYQPFKTANHSWISSSSPINVLCKKEVINKCVQASACNQRTQQL